MRPVSKGAAPRAYTRYQDAIGDLETVLGEYCSYCEERFSAALEVEHVSPKSRGGALLDWANFLVACKTCNVAKGSKAAAPATSLLPDLDNTFLALRYSKGGFVEANPNLPQAIKNLASEMISLLKLDAHYGTPKKKPTKRDKRSTVRADRWDLALGVREDYLVLAANNPQRALNLVIEAARGWGFFSVWMTVFEGLPEVRSALIGAFKGTSKDCFNGNGDPIQRPQGRI